MCRLMSATRVRRIPPTTTPTLVRGSLRSGTRWPALVAAAAERARQAGERVVAAVDHPLLQRDDRVVGDVDVLRADLAAALGDVAHADAHLAGEQVAPVVRVQRVHLELRVADEHARAREALLVVLVVADHVADVLA